MILKGQTHIFGNNIDTDVIIPARYLSTFEEAELAKHCMEDIDDKFAQNVNGGDIIVAGDNFGCGSSREHAPIAIKAVGVSCVIAKSFARIFFRNSINIGLPIFECPEAVEDIKAGDSLEVDVKEGLIKNITRNVEYKCEGFPDFLLGIINEGGLIGYRGK